MSVKREQSFYSFEYGVNSRVPDFTIDDKELADANNIDIDAAAIGSKRLGYAKLSAATLNGGTYGMRRFYPSSGSPVLLVGDYNGTLKKLPAFTDYKTGLVVGVDTDFEPHVSRGTLYMYSFNGANGPQKFDGSTVTSVPGSPPTASFGVAFQRRLFLDDPSNHGRLVIGPIGDDDDWTTDYIDIDLDGDDDVQNAIVLNGYLYVFTRNSIHYIQGRSALSFITRLLDSTIGCDSPNTIAKWKSNIIWFGTDGKVYEWDGTSRPMEISWKVQNEINYMVSRKAKAFGYVKGDQYRLSFSEDTGDGTRNDKTIVFYLNKRDKKNFPSAIPWNYGVDFADVWTGPGDSGEISFGWRDSQYVYYADSGNSDDGDNIIMELVSKNYQIGAPERDKTATVFWLHANNANTTYDVKIEGDNGLTDSGFMNVDLGADPNVLVWDEGNWDEKNWGSVGLKQKKEYVTAGVTGKLLKFTIKEESTAKDVELYGFTWEHDEEKP